VSLDSGGLYRSTDGGASFTKLLKVTRAYLFAFGKPAPGSSTPALYLYGRIDDSGDEIFRSLDLGATWTELTDARVAVGDGPSVMEASAQTYGMVFIGTNGRGIYVGEPLPREQSDKGF
jgi:xyloglucan-specific exo-beta-1,4-glucanase